MKISRALASFLDDARQSDSYWVERAKLSFAQLLEKRRKNRGLTNKALADSLGASGAYVSKVFRGDTNLTIESMVKLARATGGQLDIRIVDEAASSAGKDWVLQTRGQAQRATPIVITPTAAPSVTTQPAANHDAYSALHGRLLRKRDAAIA